MQRGLGEMALEPVEQRRDRELTLGPTMLFGLAAGLLLLCGVCFYAGYSLGRRGSGDAQSVAAQAPASTSGAMPAASTQAKPSASQAGAQPPIATQVADALPADGTSSGDAAATPAPPGVQPSVQSALPAQAGGTPPATPVSGQAVQPAMAQTGAWMVQIAAVSSPDDANVLASALRRRGYNVTVRHDPADNLMHVQVGPFAARNDALAMRQKLLNDGYNALVQP